MTMKIIKILDNVKNWKEFIVEDTDALYSVSFYKPTRFVSIMEIAPIAGRVNEESELHHMIKCCVSEHLHEDI
jgi:hypothetical protein